MIDTLLHIPSAQILAFMLGALALNVAPGPDVMFVSACGIRGGARAGMLAGFGVGLGALWHVVFATAGLGTVIAAHPQAQIAIKWAGAAYLLWLAWQSWHSPHPAGAAAPQLHPRPQLHPPPHHQPQPRPGTASLIARGALNNLLNPKPVLFLVAFLPQFTNPAWGPVWHQILGLGLMFVASGTLITMGYGAAAGLARHGLARRMGWLNRLVSVMFVGLAARLVSR